MSDNDIHLTLMPWWIQKINYGWAIVYIEGLQLMIVFYLANTVDPKGNIYLDLLSSPKSVVYKE